MTSEALPGAKVFRDLLSGMPSLLPPCLRRTTPSVAPPHAPSSRLHFVSLACGSRTVAPRYLGSGDGPPRLVVAVPSGHALEKLERVPLETIVDLPLIFFTRQLIPGFHAQIVELFQRVGAFPKIAQYAVHLQTIVGLVASGIGIAILPGSAERVSREGVIYRPLDAPDATSWIGLARVEGDDSMLVENFIRTVREVAEVETLSDVQKHRG